MIPNVAILSQPRADRPSTHSTSTNQQVASRHRTAALAAEARRVGRRRSIAERVAQRSQFNDRRLPDEASLQISKRAKRRASRLGLAFHRAIESLWGSGDFNEAISIFREYQSELRRRVEGLPEPG